MRVKCWQRNRKLWHTGKDSNPHRTALEAGILPLDDRYILAALVGFEPTMSESKSDAFGR